jgi:hypothetical protein
MAVYARCQSTFPPPWTDAMRQASTARWPTLPITTIQPITREAVVRQQAEPGYLARLVRRLPAPVSPTLPWTRIWRCWIRRWRTGSLIRARPER